MTKLIVILRGFGFLTGASSGNSPKLTHCCIPNARNVDSGIALQLGPSQVAVHRNLPVTLGVHPDVIHRCDILHASQPISKGEKIIEQIFQS